MNWQVNFMWLILAAAIIAILLFFLFKNYPALILLAILLPAGGFYHQFYNIQLAPLAPSLKITTSSVVILPADMMNAAYQRLLSADQAGLLAGITLGRKDGMSWSLLDKLSLSGVRHLTALSGLHISIVVLSLAGTLKWLWPRKRRLRFVLLAILSLIFVILTGLRVSALRAVFMASVVGLSKTSERLYSPRNSIAAAGAFLLLFDPNKLVFDIGFQLSFLAVIGIVYISPVLKGLFRIKSIGFLDWKNIGLITISAQLATAPLLIHYFSNFTFTGFVANVLILPLVPATMGLGYLTGLLYYLVKPIAVIGGWLAAALLEYQLLVVDIFSILKLPFNPEISWWVIGIYYLILTAFIWLYDRYIKKQTLSDGNSFITG